MAATAVIKVSPIPGLQLPLTNMDIESSNTLCNGLPRMHKNMDHDQQHIKNLAAIISQHKMIGKFCAASLHKHEDTPDGQTKLEVDINTMSAELIKSVLVKIVRENKLEAALEAVLKTGKWMKPVQFSSLDPNNIHGVAFKLYPKKKCLLPYEFAEGRMPVSESGTVDNFFDNLPSFVNDFFNYVEKNELADMIGLQFLGALDGDQHPPAVEFELGEKGTIKLPALRTWNSSLPAGLMPPGLVLANLLTLALLQANLGLKK